MRSEESLLDRRTTDRGAGSDGARIRSASANVWRYGRCTSRRDVSRDSGPRGGRGRSLPGSGVALGGLGPRRTSWPAQGTRGRCRRSAALLQAHDLARIVVRWRDRQRPLLRTYGPFQKPSTAASRFFEPRSRPASGEPTSSAFLGGLVAQQGDIRSMHASLIASAKATYEDLGKRASAVSSTWRHAWRRRASSRRCGRGRGGLSLGCATS